MRSDNIIDLVIALQCRHLCTLSGRFEIHIYGNHDNWRIGYICTVKLDYVGASIMPKSEV